ncbi:MAG: hypothetical protein IPF99_42685 [Deltaproteobacteria bacterium]|nr:hypothetical protein [Deltaproteobacteria bacterium]
MGDERGAGGAGESVPAEGDPVGGGVLGAGHREDARERERDGVGREQNAKGDAVDVEVGQRAETGDEGAGEVAEPGV